MYGPTFSFRLEIADHAMFKAMAAARGLKTGAFARQICARYLMLNAAKTAERITAPNAAELRQLLGEIGRLHSLINQIARSTNGGAAPSKFASDILAIRSDLDSLLMWAVELTKRRSTAKKPQTQQTTLTTR
jgi:hypothetical protein